ncbi:hypothetical protein CDAR_477691 [Caerostris darwini]|uniref:Uncharacterized protein n=1 Tax=Caerostris darwini TaxID=1538125 RepID=A0AAV4MEV2_9ARAC|nr:hypothetical protein CDAR_477691 [Caerostris darwini]
MKNIIVSHFWYGQEQGPYSVSLCELLSDNDEKNYCQPFLVRKERGPTAFPSVSVYLTMKKIIIVSHFWYGQEQEQYSVSICERLSNNDEKIIVSHFWYGQEQGPYSVSICERLSNNDEKIIVTHSGTDRNRGPTAFPSVSVYLTMMKNIIVNHFWYGQEPEPYSVSICERLFDNEENHYCQPLLVRTGTGAIQRFHL